MNRRQFAGAVTQTAISLTGLAGMGVGLVSILNHRKSPIARLINDEKGTWYNGRPSEDNISRGDDLLLYPLDEGASQRQIASWNEQVAKLVKDGYAEYL